MFNSLRKDIVNEIGVDAYANRDEERYFPEGLFLQLLADVVILAFLKGFCGFEGLGRDARQRIVAVLNSFDEAPPLITLNIRSDVDSALRQAKAPGTLSVSDGRRSLNEALVHYGMDPAIAADHALQIEAHILNEISNKSNEPVMNTNIKLFRDVLIPGSQSYATEALLAACTVYDAEACECRWTRQQALLLQPPINGVRVWYRGHTSNREYFTSIAPGETRFDPPNGPDDVVVDLHIPDGAGADTLSARLIVLLEFVKSFGMATTATERIEGVLKSYLAKENSRPFRASIFFHADQMIRNAIQKKEDDTELIASLSQKVFDEHQLSLTEFSTSMTLLAVQRMMGCWITPPEKMSMDDDCANPYIDSWRSLSALCHTLANGQYRASLTACLAELGNECYQSASVAVRSGLESDSMIFHCRRLQVACFHYQMASLLAKIVKGENLHAPLRYKMVQADEGSACTTSGIFLAPSFLFEDPQAKMKTIAEELSSGSEESDIELTNCSTLHPYFTNKFTRILIAAAKTYNLDKHFSEGMKELHALEKYFDTIQDKGDVSFEKGWIVVALQSAYQRRGDEARATHYLRLILTQMEIQHTFARIRRTHHVEDTDPNPLLT